jgi:hypothetical protein
MKILKKIKKLFSSPKKEKKVGNILIHLLDTKKVTTYTQEIRGITIFPNREDMMHYLNSTVMTTVPRHIQLLDFTEVLK